MTALHHHLKVYTPLHSILIHLGENGSGRDAVKSIVLQSLVDSEYLRAIVLDMLIMGVQFRSTQAKNITKNIFQNPKGIWEFFKETNRNSKKTTTPIYIWCRSKKQQKGQML